MMFIHGHEDGLASNDAVFATEFVGEERYPSQIIIFVVTFSSLGVHVCKVDVWRQGRCQRLASCRAPQKLPWNSVDVFCCNRYSFLR